MQKVLAWVVLFVALSGGASHAQQREMRVGWLMTWANGPFSDLTNRSFEQGLREAGFVEGKNLVLLRRSANGDSSQFPALARDLARQDVRVIFAPSKPMADAAWYASRKIPTVIATVADPVAVQYVRSLARPGGHITGVTTASAELTAKRLELLREAVPGTTRVAVLFDQRLYESCQVELTVLEAAAKKLGLTLIRVSASNASEMEGAFARMVEAKVQSVIVPLTTSTVEASPVIARLAQKYRLPVMHEISDFASVGGFITYGPDFGDIYRRAGHYVARILNGEKPAEMAMEEPAKFRLTVNLNVARALGIVVPPSVLVRADEVIE